MGQIHSIQYLRAFAALIVVIHHAQGWIPEFSYANSSLYTYKNINIWGQFGVDIFFVISGFIMAYIIGKKSHSLANVGTFFKHRVFRVVPLYWIYTTIVLVLVFQYSNIDAVANSTYFKQYGLSMFFIPYLQDGAISTPLLAVGWTLILEMYFYSAITVFWLVFNKYWHLPLIAFMVFCVYFATVSNIQLGWVLNNLYLIEFCLGIIVALLYSYIKAFNKYLLWIMLLIGIALAIYSVNYSTSNALFYIRASSAFLIVFSALYLNAYMPKNKGLLFLGDSSYTFYLSHLIVFYVLAYALSKLNIHFDNAYVFVGFMTLVALVANVFLYKLIEVPLIKWIKLKA